MPQTPRRPCDPVEYVDHEPGVWFLVRDGDALFLDARYSYSALIDDSALVRLTEAEVEAYRCGGRDVLTRLARGIHHSAPYLPESEAYARNLYRGPDGRAYRDAVRAAITGHRWIDEHGG